MVKPINNRWDLARRILGAENGEKVEFHDGVATIIRGGKENSILWKTLPTPEFIAKRVINYYHKLRDGVLRIRCSLNTHQSDHFGLLKCEALAYLGNVDKILDGIGDPGKIVLKGMFPPGGRENPMVELRRVTGLSEERIIREYNRAVVTVAPEFWKRGLYVEIDKLGDLSTDRIAGDVNG